MGVLNLQANQVTFPNRYLKFSFGSILNDQNKLKRPYNLKINFDNIAFIELKEKRVYVANMLCFLLLIFVICLSVFYNLLIYTIIPFFLLYITIDLKKLNHAIMTIQKNGEITVIKLRKDEMKEAKILVFKRQ